MRIRKFDFLLFCFCFFVLKNVLAIDISRYRFRVMPETSYYGGIQSIAKDRLGRIWYTGPDAVFMYDNNSFYQLNELVSASQPKSKWGYGTLITDKQGNLFLAANHGLLQLNYERFSFDLKVPGKIRSICLHENGKLYMLSGDSLLTYDQRSKSLEGFSLPKGKYFSFIISLNGKLFVSQEGHLYRVEPQKRRLVLFADFGTFANLVNDALEFEGDYYFLTQRGGVHVTKPNGEIKRHIPVTVPGNPSVISKKLYLDKSGVIWVATQGGLFLYNPADGSSSLLKMNLNDAFSLPNNSIWTIYQDPDQGTWIGTYGGKIAYCSLYDARVRYFNPSPGGLNHPIVSSFEEDHRGNIWIGTEGGGLNYWNRGDDSFSHFLKSGTHSLNSNMIKTLHFDPLKKQLLISSFNGGIVAYNPKQGYFEDLGFISAQNNQLLTIYNFIRDNQGTWWMTDPDKSFFYRRKSGGDPETIRVIGANNNRLDLEVEALYMDHQNNLCFVTHKGLFVADRNTLKVKKCYFIKNSPFSANNLCCYLKSSTGDVWLGTLGRGVNVLKKDGSYLNFNSANGFSPKMVFGILEDNASGNIWFSTSDGLYYYNQRVQKFEKAKFYRENSCGAFYIRSAFKTQKGEMLFGGTNGFLLFDPSYLDKNPQKPRVFFTDFLVNNTRVTATSYQSPLTKDISSLANRSNDRIHLSSKESNIEIRFSSNSYLAADKNQYSYRMLGLSKRWLPINAKQKSVQFFNLSSGDYTFEIKASNNDGIWGDEISKLYLHVDPPFFLSWWAYLLYVLVAFGLLFFIVRYYTNKKVFKERLALEALKEQNLRELNQARTDFFTHISHDLKTPLTLVLDPLKQLKETVLGNDNAMGYMQLIEKNVTRIQRMISQLLRFREIESHKITLDPKAGNFVSFVRDIFGLFELYANKKGIETNIASHEEQIFVAFDYDVIEKILTNLFSNALKYTPNKGYVGVRIYESIEEELARLPLNPNKEQRRYISLEVLNTGDSFSDQEMSKLFTSFNRVSSRRPDFESSSGLGLAIVKGLVDVLEGSIWMENKADKISFTITLPLKIESNSRDMEGNVYDYTISEIDEIMTETSDVDSVTRSARKANSILLIEDNPDLRGYLEQRLSERYNVYTARDGAEGIIKAEKIYPQLIVTDLVMPNSSGFEVCRRLRQNFKTSHIPVIMISGVGDENQNRLKALEYGASVFIDKPFQVEYLLQQAESILKNQQELRDLYSKRLVVDPSKVTVTSMDEELLTRAMKFIEQNMDNSEYSVDDFVSDMNVGRTILYQKINDIVGMSIKEFILNIRLKRSADLLENSDLTVAEVAYRTGFNNAKYFSVCFKKQFDLSPTEYKRKAQSEKSS